MIRLTNVALSFGDQTIFDKITALIQPYEKIGLVGPNGAGKSTMLKVIAGIQELNGGRVTREGGMSIAYLPQEVVLVSSLSIFDEAMQAYGDLGKWHVREKELEAAGQQGCEEYAHLHADLAHHDHGAKAAHARRVLTGLGFENEKHNDLVNTLSVGWQMRVVLAKLLLQEADMYLFDEPTNHLDLPAREWLCKFLRDSSSGYLLISHDRYVLDAVCDKTLVLGHGRMREYKGNYSTYRRQYEENLVHQQAARAAQNREIAEKKKTIERFRAKASKAKMAQSLIKQLDRIERVEVDEEALPKVRLPFPPLERTGAVVLKVEKLSKSFGDKLIFADATFEVPRGERVAIIAPNGAGKTTMLSCIRGALEASSGTATFGHNVTTAVFEQEQINALNLSNTVFDEVDRVACRIMREKVRHVLGALLFSGSTVKKKIKVLSGGERNRVALAKVLVQDANLLLLDEPTNHLDLLSKQMLAEGLAAYQGSLIFVSHDRDIVEQVATAIISIDHGQVSYFPGSYEAFMYQREQQGAPEAPTASMGSTKNTGSSPKDKRKEINRLEREIAKLEANEQKLAEQLGDHEYGTPEYDATLARYEKVQEQVAARQDEWEKLSAE